MTGEGKRSLSRNHRKGTVSVLDLGLKTVLDLVDVGYTECHSVVVLDAACCSSVGQAGQRHSWGLVDELHQIVDVLLEGRDRPSAHCHHVHSAWVNTLGRFRQRAILKDDRGVTTGGREVVQEDLALLSTVTRPWDLCR